MRRLHVGETHPPHPRVALAEYLIGPLHRHLTHQGQGVGLELLGEVLPAALPWRINAVNLAVVAKSLSWQPTHDHALPVGDVEMPPMNRPEMVLADYRGPGPRFLRPYRGRLLDLQHKRGRTCLKRSFNHMSILPKPRQLSKVYSGSITPLPSIPHGSTGNSKESLKLILQELLK
jgi:hypothetical protein